MTKNSEPPPPTSAAWDGDRRDGPIGATVVRIAPQADPYRLPPPQRGVAEGRWRPSSYTKAAPHARPSAGPPRMTSARWRVPDDAAGWRCVRPTRPRNSRWMRWRWRCGASAATTTPAAGGGVTTAPNPLTPTVIAALDPDRRPAASVRLGRCHNSCAVWCVRIRPRCSMSSFGGRAGRAVRSISFLCVRPTTIGRRCAWPNRRCPPRVGHFGTRSTRARERRAVDARSTPGLRGGPEASDHPRSAPAHRRPARPACLVARGMPTAGRRCRPVLALIGPRAGAIALVKTRRSPMTLTRVPTRTVWRTRARSTIDGGVFLQYAGLTRTEGDHAWLRTARSC